MIGARRRKVLSHSLHVDDVGVVGSQAASPGDIHAARNDQPAG